LLLWKQAGGRGSGEAKNAEAKCLLCFVSTWLRLTPPGRERPRAARRSAPSRVIHLRNVHKRRNVAKLACQSTSLSRDLSFRHLQVYPRKGLESSSQAAFASQLHHKKRGSERAMQATCAAPETNRRHADTICASPSSSTVSGGDGGMFLVFCVRATPASPFSCRETALLPAGGHTPA
jgi:hypothetical protein